MRPLSPVVTLALFCAACAGAPTREAAQISDEAGFQAEIRAFFPGPADVGALKAALTAKGFACEDVAPVEARADYLMAQCTRTDRQDGCAVERSVALRYAPGAGSLARAEGASRRACEGSAP